MEKNYEIKNPKELEGTTLTEKAKARVAFLVQNMKSKLTSGFDKLKKTLFKDSYEQQEVSPVVEEPTPVEDVQVQQVPVQETKVEEVQNDGKTYIFKSKMDIDTATSVDYKPLKISDVFKNKVKTRTLSEFHKNVQLEVNVEEPIEELQTFDKSEGIQIYKKQDARRIALLNELRELQAGMQRTVQEYGLVKSDVVEEEMAKVA